VRVDLEVAAKHGLVRCGGKQPFQWVLLASQDPAHVVHDIVARHTKPFKVSQLKDAYRQRVDAELDTGGLKMSEFLATIPGLQLHPENHLPNMLVSCTASSLSSRPSESPWEVFNDSSETACPARDAAAVFHQGELEFLTELKGKLAEIPASTELDFAAVKDVMRATWAGIDEAVPLTNGLMSKVQAEGFSGYIARKLVGSVLQQPVLNGSFYAIGGLANVCDASKLHEADALVDTDECIAEFQGAIVRGEASMPSQSPSDMEDAAGTPAARRHGSIQEWTVLQV